jgi:hypothetical protein
MPTQAPIADGVGEGEDDVLTEADIEGLTELLAVADTEDVADATSDGGIGGPVAAGVDVASVDRVAVGLGG